MTTDLKPLFGFRHLTATKAKKDATASLQAKVGEGPKGPPTKTPVERPVLAAKIGAGKLVG